MAKLDISVWGHNVTILDDDRILIFAQGDPINAIHLCKSCEKLVVEFAKALSDQMRHNEKLERKLVKLLDEK